MVGIAGVPGSGKSTTAKAVCAKINSMRPRLDKHNVAVVVGMDGESYPMCYVIHQYMSLMLVTSTCVDAACDRRCTVIQPMSARVDVEWTVTLRSAEQALHEFPTIFSRLSEYQHKNWGCNHQYGITRGLATAKSVCAHQQLHTSHRISLHSSTAGSVPRS